MYAQVSTVAFEGIEAKPVDVQVPEVQRIEEAARPK